MKTGAAGKLDTRITLRQPQEGRDKLGTVTPIQYTDIPAWAERRNPRGSEVLATVGLTGKADAVFRIRWRSGITNRWDLVDLQTGATYDIQNIAPVDRRRYLDLTCVAHEVPSPVR